MQDSLSLLEEAEQFCDQRQWSQAEHLLRLGPAEHVGLLEPADEVGKVPKKIDASPPLDDFSVHEIETAVSSDHRELSAGSSGWRAGPDGPHNS